jgi:UDP-2-acetamido-3-amino-2,3-dideoxy-glucuronate N-acetyltransferase
MSELKLAFLGCGRWGKNLLRAFSQIPDCTIRAICTRNQSARELAVQHNANWYQQPTEIWQDEQIDAVVIATPDPTHYSFAKTALENGKHLFVEKPLALTARECRELTDLAHSKKLTLAVGHIYHYHPATSVLRQIIDEQQWGTLQDIELNNTDLKNYPADSELLTGTIVHDLALLSALFPGDPMIEMVQAIRIGNKIACLRAQLRYQQVSIAIHSSIIYPVANRDMVLTFERAIVRFERAGKGRLMAYIATVAPDGMQYQDSFSIHQEIPFPFQEPLANECGDFIDSIQHRRAPRADGVNATAIAETLDLMRSRVEIR